MLLFSLGLSVCLSVHLACSYFCSNSQDGFKMMHVICIKGKIFLTENGIFKRNSSCTGIHISIFFFDFLSMCCLIPVHIPVRTTLLRFSVGHFQLKMVVHATGDSDTGTHKVIQTNYRSLHYFSASSYTNHLSYK